MTSKPVPPEPELGQSDPAGMSAENVANRQRVCIQSA